MVEEQPGALRLRQGGQVFLYVDPARDAWDDWIAAGKPCQAGHPREEHVGKDCVSNPTHQCFFGKKTRLCRTPCCNKPAPPKPVVSREEKHERAHGTRLHRQCEFCRQRAFNAGVEAAQNRHKGTQCLNVAKSSPAQLAQAQLWRRKRNLRWLLEGAQSIEDAWFFHDAFNEGWTAHVREDVAQRLQEI